MYPGGAVTRYGTKGATMKKVFFDDAKMKVIGKKNFKGDKKLIDFYLITAGNEMIYAFTRNYTFGTYELCKAGIRANELAAKKSKDTSVMKLVNYYRIMVPYLADEYELKLA